MIRKAAIEDLEGILILIQKIKKQMEEEGNPQWNSEYPGEREYKADILSGELYLKELEGSIAGFMAVNDCLYKEYQDAEWTTPLPAGTVHRLAVNPEYRRRGVAGQLLSFAETVLQEQGMKSIRLDTFSLNYSTQRLFKNKGYRFAGEIFMKGRKIPYLCFEKPL